MSGRGTEVKAGFCLFCSFKIGDITAYLCADGDKQTERETLMMKKREGSNICKESGT